MEGRSVPPGRVLKSSAKADQVFEVNRLQTVPPIHVGFCPHALEESVLPKIRAVHQGTAVPSQRLPGDSFLVHTQLQMDAVRVSDRRRRRIEGWIEHARIDLLVDGFVGFGIISFFQDQAERAEKVLGGASLARVDGLVAGVHGDAEGLGGNFLGGIGVIDRVVDGQGEFRAFRRPSLS